MNSLSRREFRLLLLVFLSVLAKCDAAAPAELRVGRAGHAFDHLGGIGEQAPTAVASGANIIYATGVGSIGYSGLPPKADFDAQLKLISTYNQKSKAQGIRLAMGYVCATSIVKLETFDKNWSQEFRAKFATPPSEWRQVGRDGKHLVSWYGGDYQPACMNNPDWRKYEQNIVRWQLESRHDGIFFDNPTVHPQGCYCRFCLDKFSKWLRAKAMATPEPFNQLPELHPQEFLQFRCTTARDFLAEMRQFARSIKPSAFVTCNNSLNSSGALYSQARTYAYHIGEMSQAEDWVVVEDMSQQPRQLANGKYVEYGSVYPVLHAISHGKPIVAVTIADGDYHTPSNLVRLAMAEAVAHNASYLSWPTWPEPQRERMAAAIAPQAAFYREHADWLEEASPRTDALLFLPYRRFLETDKCQASQIAADLTAANVQYRVISEGTLPDELSRYLADLQTATANIYRASKFQAAADNLLPTLIVESPSVLTLGERTMLSRYQAKGGIVFDASSSPVLTNGLGRTSVQVTSAQAPAPSVRVVLSDHPGGIVAHVYNLGIERISSFEDRVNPVSPVELKLRIPGRKVKQVRVMSADPATKEGPLKFTSDKTKTGTWITTTLPRLDVFALILMEY